MEKKDKIEEGEAAAAGEPLTEEERTAQREAADKTRIRMLGSFAGYLDISLSRKRLVFGIIFSYIAVRSIAMIVVGGMYFKSCEVKPMIPIYLLTAGIMSLLSVPLLARLIISYLSKDNVRVRVGRLPLACCPNCALALAQFVWFIVGCVMVYGLPEEHRHNPHCDRFLYLFAFSMITLCLIVVPIFLSIVCLLKAYYVKLVDYALSH